MKRDKKRLNKRKKESESYEPENELYDPFDFENPVKPIKPRQV